jgi:hypothetical protein
MSQYPALETQKAAQMSKYQALETQKAAPMLKYQALAVELRSLLKVIHIKSR